jgi:hypothetical protein
MNLLEEDPLKRAQEEQKQFEEEESAGDSLEKDEMTTKKK